jgi:hypothetical protein
MDGDGVAAVETPAVVEVEKLVSTGLVCWKLPPTGVDVEAAAGVWADGEKAIRVEEEVSSV